jgi:predicted lipoprotein with Yx(FWY)xxD motif
MGAGLERHKGGKSSPRWAVAVPLAAAVTVAAAGCGSGGSGGSATPGNTHRAGASPGAAMVKASRSSLGMILTDGKGRAVYLFEKDTGTKPSCSGACAAAWPPVLTTGRPVAGSGVTAALLGTVHRTNGTVQVTYAGHPLYFFTADQKPGDISGEGTQAFGGGWDLVSPAGKKVEKPGD